MACYRVNFTFTFTFYLAVYMVCSEASEDSPASIFTGYSLVQEAAEGTGSMKMRQLYRKVSGNAFSLWDKYQGQSYSR